eukprot:7964750-Alexandrium_andersonii.AAC.1
MCIRDRARGAGDGGATCAPTRRGRSRPAPNVHRQACNKRCRSSHGLATVCNGLLRSLSGLSLIHI